MATNDFVQDLVEKLSEDSVEYVVISLQKGKNDIEGPKSNAFYNVRTPAGAEMILATLQEIFQQRDVSELLDSLDSIDKDSDEGDFKEGAD